jgi:predicted nicotinamide N-methyase
MYAGSGMGPGAVVWECGFSLAEYLVRCPGEVEGRRAIELGSGTGIGGIVAALLGAKMVILTDLPPLVPLLESNARRNGLATPRVSAAALDWGDAALPPSFRVEAWEVVLMADPVYTTSQVPAFAATLELLMGCGSRALLAHKHRHAEVDSALFGAISAMGCLCEQRGVSCVDGRVKVYSLSKEKGSLSSC